MFSSEFQKNISCIKCIKFTNKVDSSPNKNILKRKIREIINKESKRKELVEEYMELNNELLLIDEKIENILHAIRKQIDNPDNIIMKIESISQSKAKI